MGYGDDQGSTIEYSSDCSVCLKYSLVRWIFYVEQGIQRSTVFYNDHASYDYEVKVEVTSEQVFLCLSEWLSASERKRCSCVRG